uniref:Uncharacterized protein n=1 Tax=Anguilla anguilla TaxID=7936 RepID=A0A0E9QY76_ANGAN
MGGNGSTHNNCLLFHDPSVCLLYSQFSTQLWMQQSCIINYMIQKVKPISHPNLKKHHRLYYLI